MFFKKVNMKQATWEVVTPPGLSGLELVRAQILVNSINFAALTP